MLPWCYVDVDTPLMEHSLELTPTFSDEGTLMLLLVTKKEGLLSWSRLPLKSLGAGTSGRLGGTCAAVAVRLS